MKKFLPIFVLLIIFLGLGVFGYLSLFKPAGKTVDFKIVQGEGTREIAANLKKEGLINYPWVFTLYVYQHHYLLQPGTYKIETSMSPINIANLLSGGNVDEKVVTIPEGWRVTQIDQELAEKKIIKKGEFTKIASSDEGYLFPDTYRLSADFKAEDIQGLMLENFNKKVYSQLGKTKVTSKIIILASIVEREAKFDDDRAKIAGVYFNRLQTGMRLEADPTIQYAKGSWDPIKRSDYHGFSSLYNTYLNSGLPPGPICNPGFASINATLNPEKHGYYFFFHKKDGHAVYSRTLDEHNANLAKYR